MWERWTKEFSIPHGLRSARIRILDVIRVGQSKCMSFLCKYRTSAVDFVWISNKSVNYEKSFSVTVVGMVLVVVVQSMKQFAQGEEKRKVWSPKSPLASTVCGTADGTQSRLNYDVFEWFPMCCISWDCDCQFIWFMIVRCYSSSPSPPGFTSAICRRKRKMPNIIFSMF